MAVGVWFLFIYECIAISFAKHYVIRSSCACVCAHEYEKIFSIYPLGKSKMGRLVIGRADLYRSFVECFLGIVSHMVLQSSHRLSPLFMWKEISIIPTLANASKRCEFNDKELKMFAISWCCQFYQCFKSRDVTIRQRHHFFSLLFTLFLLLICYAQMECQRNQIKRNQSEILNSRQNVSDVAIPKVWAI